MDIVGYAKEHPWMTGVIVIVGGVIFLALTGIFDGGGSSGAGAASGPSDNILAAQINADAVTKAAQIQASSALGSDTLASNVAMAQIGASKETNLAYIEAQKTLGLKTIEGQTSAVIATIQGQQAQYQSVIGSLGQLKKKNRDDVLQALVTGQAYYPQPNPGNSASAIIGSLGNLASNVSGLIPYI